MSRCVLEYYEYASSDALPVKFDEPEPRHAPRPPSPVGNGEFGTGRQ